VACVTETVWLATGSCCPRKDGIADDTHAIAATDAAERIRTADDKQVPLRMLRNPHSNMGPMLTLNPERIRARADDGILSTSCGQTIKKLSEPLINCLSTAALKGYLFRNQITTAYCETSAGNRQMGQKAAIYVTNFWSGTWKNHFID
jgi:hypothetical protein